jgi:hypothetical protein
VSVWPARGGEDPSTEGLGSLEGAVLDAAGVGLVAAGAGEPVAGWHAASAMTRTAASGARRDEADMWPS